MRGPAAGRNIKTYGVNLIDFVPGYYLGIVYFNQSKYREAIDELERVKSRGLFSSRDPEYGRMMEIIEKAQSALRPVTPTVPPSSEPAAKTPEPTEKQREAAMLARYSESLMQRGDLDGARTAIESARVLDPQNPDLLRLSSDLSRLGVERNARLEQDEREMKTRKTTETPTTVDEGRRLLASGKLDEVWTLVENARSRGLSDPLLDALARDVGLARGLRDLDELIRASRWQQARQKLRQLEALNPSHPELVRLRTVVLERASAEAADSNLREGVLAFYSGDYETSVEILGRLASVKKESADIVFLLADASSLETPTNLHQSNTRQIRFGVEQIIVKPKLWGLTAFPLRGGIFSDQQYFKESGLEPASYVGLTAGFGFVWSRISLDLAYVHKSGRFRSRDAVVPTRGAVIIVGSDANHRFNSNQLYLSAIVRF